MKRLFLLFLVACGNDQAIDPGPDAAPVIDGAAEFRNACAMCHGDDGAGTTKAPQILDPVKAYASYVVRHGRGAEMGFADGMAAFDPTMLPDAKLTAIIDWLAAAPKPADGGGLYTRFCANCHGANSRGGRTGKSIRNETSFSIVRTGHGGTSFGSRTSYMPAFDRAAITDAELVAIRSYIQTL